MPEYELQKCVDHYKGDYRVRKLTCREHFLVMSFAQFTGRESLRDIENCLTAFSGKLYTCALVFIPAPNSIIRRVL